MMTSEVEMLKQIAALKEKYHMRGIKAEFEAEGSSFSQLARLSIVSARLGLGVFLKIGGVEAKTDVKNALELDVRGIIAPMVESKFGLKKFLDIVDSVYMEKNVHKAFNIETKGAVNKLNEILDFAAGKIDAVTVGRSDLSRSYFDEDITPDSPFIMDLLYQIGQECKTRGLKMTVGGSVSANTIRILKKNPELCELISFVETRKAILPTASWLGDDSVIREVLLFEKLYIESVTTLNTHLLHADLKRLEQLNDRVA